METTEETDKKTSVKEVISESTVKGVDEIEHEKESTEMEATTSLPEEKIHEYSNENEPEPPGCELAIDLMNVCRPNTSHFLEIPKQNSCLTENIDWDLFEHEVRTDGSNLFSRTVSRNGRNSGSSKRSSRSNSINSNVSEPEPPGEEEIELLTEIPVILLRSRSSSTSSSSRSRSRSRGRSASNDKYDKERSRSGGERSGSCSRRKREKSVTRRDSDFLILDSIEVDASPRSRGASVDDDIVEVEVIRSNIERSECLKSSRSNSVERRSRRSPSRRSHSRRSQSRTSKSRSFESRRPPSISTLPVNDLRDKIRRRRQKSTSPGYENWRRDKRRREDERSREKRREDEWKRRSDAFIAKLGGPPEPRGFDEPRCSFVNYGRQYQTHVNPGYDPGHHQELTKNINHGTLHPQTPSPEVVQLDEDEPPARRSISRCDLMSEYFENEADTWDAGHYSKDRDDFNHFISSTEDRADAGCSGNDIDLRNLSNLALNYGENLRPGNYLLVNFDLLSVGSGLGSSIYQLGCWSWHGDSFLQCVVPEENGMMREQAKQHRHWPLIELSGCHYVRNPAKGQFIRCVQEEEAMKQFLGFLETGKNRVRPVHDGIILFSYNPEVITQLVKSIRRFGLFDKFVNIVTGFGDLVTFLSQKNPGKYSSLNSTLENDYEKTFARKMPPLMMSDDRSKMSQEILIKVLNVDTAPTFSNFFSSHSNPLTSSKSLRLINFKSTEERKELFRPLELSIAHQLNQQNVDLTLEGLYAEQGMWNHQKSSG